MATEKGNRDLGKVTPCEEKGARVAIKLTSDSMPRSRQPHSFRGLNYFKRQLATVGNWKFSHIRETRTGIL